MSTNVRIFKVKYFGPTSFKGSRIQITDERFNKTIMIPYNYEVNSAVDGAYLHLQSLGFNDLQIAEGKDNMYLITSDFKTQIK